MFKIFQIIYVNQVHSFLLLSILLYEYVTVYLCIHPLKNICVIYRSGWL